MTRARAWMLMTAAAAALAACGGDDGSGDAADDGSADAADEGGTADADAGDVAAPPPPPGCPAGFDTDTGTLFYVDPATGADDNDGSQAHPWRSIQYVVDNLVDCTDQFGTPLHPDAPVQGGDTILLVGADGHDQTLEITGCCGKEVEARSAWQPWPFPNLIDFPAVPITVPTECCVLRLPRLGKGEGAAIRKTHDRTGTEGRDNLRIVAEGGLRWTSWPAVTATARAVVPVPCSPTERSGVGDVASPHSACFRHPSRR